MKRNLNEKSRRENGEWRVRREAFLACMTGYARRGASLFGSGKFFILYSSFFILLLLSGCRKDLCYTHDEHGWAVKVNVVADWEQEWERMHETDWEQNWMEDFSCSYDELRPDVADGIRVLVYPDQGDRYNEYNLEAEGGRLSMAEGMNSLLFYNNDTEYIVFSDLDASAAASATSGDIMSPLNVTSSSVAPVSVAFTKKPCMGCTVSAPACVLTSPPSASVADDIVLPS